MDYKLSVDLLAGFKGSGKTFFINKAADILWKETKTVFIQNEIGAEKLEFSGNSKERMHEEITGGCICCTATNLLEDTIHRVIKEFKPNKIVLELAQTANLRDVPNMFSKIGGVSAQIGHVIYQANAVDFSKRMLISGRFLKDQLSSVSVLLINRADRVTDAKLGIIRDFALAANPEIVIKTLNDEWNEEEIKEIYEKSHLVKRKGGLGSSLKLDISFSDFNRN